MFMRTLVFGAIALGLGLMAFMIAAPGIMLGSVSNDIIKSYEEAGIDVSECKKSRSFFDPSGGIRDCTQAAFKDIAKKLDEAAAEDFDGSR